MYTQQNRKLKVFTSLPDDTLLLQTLQGMEAVSRPFVYNLDLVSTDSNIKAASIVGTPIHVSVADMGNRERYFSGFVRSFSRGAADARGMTPYRIDLVPWLWFLTQISDCRIFQEQSAQQIIEAVVKKAAGATGLRCDIEFRKVTRGQSPREYCVQYRETSFNFINRLLEEEGLFYFFEHTAGSSKMVVADAPSSLPFCAYQKDGFYAPGVPAIPPLSDVINSLSESTEVKTGKVALTDYNFQTPHDSLMVTLTAEDRGLELYDFPGVHQTVTEGDEVATVRVQEHRGIVTRYEGAGNIRHFCAGHRFALVGWPATRALSAAAKEMVLLSVTHSANQDIQPSGGSGGGADAFYSNSFVCVPSSAPLRPARRTPKPHIHGSQTAVVKGKDGEEIWTDSYGRVKVHFHWDREERSGDERSCWIRVAQAWAGRNWGAFFLPRVGQEVVVSFLEGDPDRPLIIGSVYNAHQMPPYELPANQTRTTLKSLTSKDGAGFNEIRFEDKKGAEQIFVNAQRNLDLNVLADAMHSVHGSSHTTIGGVDKDGNKVGDRREKVFKNSDLYVQGDSRLLVDGKTSSTIGGDVYYDFKQNHQTKVKTESFLSAETIIIDGSKGVCVKGPGGFILWDSAGITIVGNLVKINSGGSALSSSIGGSPDQPEEPTASDTDQAGKVSNK